MAILQGLAPILFLLPAAVQAFTCPPLGPVLPIPTGLDSKHPLLVKMAQDLTGAIEAGILSFSDTQTSFSLQITGLDKDLYAYHHTAPQMGAGGTKKVDGDTGYRIASISKVITTLATMLQDVCMDDPITKYIPELRSGPNPGGRDWNQVTLRGLTSHLAGLGRDYATFDLLNAEGLPPAELLGLPSVDEKELAPCGKNPQDKLCTRKQFMAGIKNRTATYQGNDRASYSNLGFSLLGYAIESITGMTYEELIQKKIFKPLGMCNSSTILPKNGTGAVPVIQNDWFYKGGHVDAAGGVYSTSNDLSKFMRGIMNHRLMKPHETKAWYKPTAFTSSLNTAYGESWEIFRTDPLSNVTSDGRIIDVITKSGGLTAYYSRILMIPELGYGITILTAGNIVALDPLSTLSLETTIPVFDQIAREQAHKSFVGVYTVDEEDTTLNSTLELTIDDGPGLKVKSLINRDVDVLASLAQIFGGFVTGTIDARLFSQDIVDKDDGDTYFNMGVEFIPDAVQPGTDEETTEGLKKRTAPLFPHMAARNANPFERARRGALFGDARLCFGDVDTLPWGGKPLTEFVFKRKGGKKGKVTGVQLTGFRVSLEKV